MYTKVQFPYHVAGLSSSRACLCECACRNHVAVLLYPSTHVVSVSDEPPLVSAALPGDIRTIASQILQCLHFLNAMNLTHTDAGLHEGECFAVAASSHEHRTNWSFHSRSLYTTCSVTRGCIEHYDVRSHASLCGEPHFAWSFAEDIKCRNAMLKDSRGELAPFSEWYVSFEPPRPSTTVARLVSASALVGTVACHDITT